ncbi:hypothetical protein JHK87_022274 [Glycine soja]|nr:hypothetical protein JHK87_022274 [Glycine soja]
MHALAVEHLTPSLAALRIELCPGYMSDGNFWKIYFVLMHPRLSKTDAAILSTPQLEIFFERLTEKPDIKLWVVSLYNNSRATLWFPVIKCPSSTMEQLFFGSFKFHMNPESYS